MQYKYKQFFMENKAMKKYSEIEVDFASGKSNKAIGKKGKKKAPALGKKKPKQKVKTAAKKKAPAVAKKVKKQIGKPKG